jgi:hypothetical protein
MELDDAVLTDDVEFTTAELFIVDAAELLYGTEL